MKENSLPNNCGRCPGRLRAVRNVSVTCASPVGEESYFELCVSVRGSEWEDDNPLHLRMP